MENVFITKSVKSFSISPSPVCAHTGGKMHSQYFKEKRKMPLKPRKLTYFKHFARKAIS